jgi:hypothetical protein
MIETIAEGEHFTKQLGSKSRRKSKTKKRNSSKRM